MRSLTKRTLLRVEELERRDVLSAASVLGQGPPIIPSGLLTALASPAAEVRSEQATSSLTQNVARYIPSDPEVPGNPVVPPGLLTALASPGAEFRSEQAFLSLTENVLNHGPPIEPPTVDGPSPTF